MEVREGEGRRARAWLFPCRKWLDGGIDDNLIERTLSPGPLPDSEGDTAILDVGLRVGRPIPILSVRDCPGGGVFFTVPPDQQVVPLVPNALVAKDSFPWLSETQNKAAACRWCLRDKFLCAVQSTVLLWHCRRFTSPEILRSSTDADGHADSVFLKLTEPMEVGQQEEEEPEAAPEPGDWAVWVTTGSNEGADTTNPVFLSVYGEDGIYRDVELNKHNHVKQTDETKTDAEKKILFGKGSTDEFKVRFGHLNTPHVHALLCIMGQVTISNW